MPLVILCGIPSSGKTTRANEIVKLLEKRTPDLPVHVISDDYSLSGKDKLYSSSREEKIARGDLKSKVNPPN